MRAYVSFALSRLHILMFVRIHELSSICMYIVGPHTDYTLFSFLLLLLLLLLGLLFFLRFLFVLFFVFVKVKAQLKSNLIRGINARFPSFHLFPLVILIVKVSSKIYSRLFRFRRNSS